MEDRLAIRLANIRRTAHNALRRGQKLDPRTVLEMTEGKKA